MEFLDNIKLSSRDGEEYTGHENSYRGGQPEIEEILDGSPALTSHTEISQLSRFWSSFIKIEVLNDTECSIVWIQYCCSLQQHISVILRRF